LNASLMGTGKTLMGVEVVKAIEAKVVLIIAPLNTYWGWWDTIQRQNDYSQKIVRIDSSNPGKQAFADLIGKKVKICLTSRKENAQTAADGEDQKYIKACIKATEAYKKANPKKKSLSKFKADDNYVNVYKWFTNSSVSHFCTIDGLFASEMDSGEGTMLQDFLDANEKGLIFDGRTLIPEELTESERSKLNINEYGKQLEAEANDSYEEPTESEDEATDDEW